MCALATGLVPGATRQLTVLCCIENQIGDEAIAHLGRAISANGVPALMALHLNHNQIGDAGVRALVASTSSIRLDTLFLDSNYISDRGLRELV